jgi:RNA polymerase sigma factor (sigma-70 family)
MKKHLAEEMGVEDLERSLEVFHGSPEARHLDRLAADLEVVNDLVADGFTGKRWNIFESALIRYGFQVLKSWLITGVIFQKIVQKGFGLYATRIPRDRLPSPEEAEEIANDALVESIASFKNEVLRPGYWRPELGASLKTYFVGQCLMRIPKALARWSRNAGREVATDPTDALFSLACSPHNDPSESLLLRMRFEDARSQIDEITRHIAYFKYFEGWSHSEIAEMLNITVGAVESRLYRLHHSA